MRTSTGTIRVEEASSTRRGRRSARGGGSRENCRGITRCASTSVPSASRSLRGPGQSTRDGTSTEQELTSLSCSQRAGDACGKFGCGRFLRIVLTLFPPFSQLTHTKEKRESSARNATVVPPLNPIPVAAFICGTCDRGFAVMSNLRRHCRVRVRSSLNPRNPSDRFAHVRRNTTRRRHKPTPIFPLPLAHSDQTPVAGDSRLRAGTRSLRRGLLHLCASSPSALLPSTHR